MPSVQTRESQSNAVRQPCPATQRAGHPAPQVVAPSALGGGHVRLAPSIPASVGFPVPSAPSGASALPPNAHRPRNPWYRRFPRRHRYRPFHRPVRCSRWVGCLNASFRKRPSERRRKEDDCPTEWRGRGLLHGAGLYNKSAFRRRRLEVRARNLRAEPTLLRANPAARAAADLTRRTRPSATRDPAAVVMTADTAVDRRLFDSAAAPARAAIVASAARGASAPGTPSRSRGTAAYPGRAPRPAAPATAVVARFALTRVHRLVARAARVTATAGNQHERHHRKARIRSWYAFRLRKIRPQPSTRILRPPARCSQSTRPL